jgi:hypothetical protein
MAFFAAIFALLLSTWGHVYLFEVKTGNNSELVLREECATQERYSLNGYVFSFRSMDGPSNFIEEDSGSS